MPRKRRKKNFKKGQPRVGTRADGNHMHGIRPDPVFQVRKFLEERFGGSSNITYVYEVYGFPVPAEITVAKWIARESLPVIHLMRLLWIAKHEGAPIDIYEYMEYPSK